MSDVQGRRRAGLANGPPPGSDEGPMRPFGRPIAPLILMVVAACGSPSGLKINEGVPVDFGTLAGGTSQSLRVTVVNQTSEALTLEGVDWLEPADASELFEVTLPSA